MPSRRVMSWTVTFLPRRVIVFSSYSGNYGLKLERALDHFFGEHFGGARTGGGHDVEVAGVGRQEVAEAGDFHVDGDAVAIEDRAVDQAVARDVLLDLLDHGGDGF